MRREAVEYGYIQDMPTGEEEQTMRVKEQTTEFRSATPGTVGAVCTRVIDLGTQETNFGPKRRLMIGWEVDELMEDGRPFLVFTTVNLSFNEGSTLSGIMRGWIGKEYTKGFDFKSLIGRPALLNLVQNDQYLNVGGVVPLPKGMTPLKVHGETIFWDMDEDPDWKEYEKLSDRMKERISKTDEYRSLKTAVNAVDDDPNDDIPF